MLETPPVNRTWSGGFYSVGGSGPKLPAVVFVPSGTVWDGRFANNGWMQELPDTITKLTWDNAALISPKTAKEKGLKQGDMVNVSVDDKSVDIAVLPVPGTADDVVVLPLGYGQNIQRSCVHRCWRERLPATKQQGPLGQFTVECYRRVRHIHLQQRRHILE